MREFGTLILAIFFTFSFAYAQDTLYIHKAGLVLTKSAIADIDSVTFTNRTSGSFAFVHDTLCIHKAGSELTKSAIADIDSVTFSNGTPTSFQLNKATLSLVVGGREKLIIISTPLDVTVGNAKWSTSDQSVATVDENGVITGVSSGKTTITLTIENKSEQCLLDVVKSPITGLGMPEVKYPIATGATIMLFGKGFKAGDKLWLHKNNNSVATVKSANMNTALKSVQSDQDILATIIEQAQTYISFAFIASEGWYSIILDDNITKFNLGNIQIETPVIPDIAYDKTKIFWEDTHCRRLQLRGKVKEITITEKNSYNELMNNFKSIYKFNQAGYLESYVDEGDSIVYEYNNNRLTKIIDYSKYSSGITGQKYTETWEFSYGNHEKYYPISLNLYTGYYGLDKWGYYSGADFRVNGVPKGTEIWVKGLTGIRHEDAYCNPSCVTINQFEVYADSIVNTLHSSTKNGADDISEKYIYTYNGAFPVYLKHWYFGDSIYSPETFQFSPIGLPIAYTGNRYEKRYIENGPFYNLSGSSLEVNNTTTWICSREYDKNYNLIKHTYNYGMTLISINYISYDKNGNWTSCYVDSGDSYYLYWTESRDITYW